MTEKIRVLVIDDDQDMCDYLSNFLTEEGYAAEIVKDGPAAVAKVKNEHFHLAILDLKMPDMDGVEVLKEIRKKDPDIGVIILTAYPSLDTAIETLKSSAFDYIQKPFEVTQIREALRIAAKKKGLLEEPREKINALLGGRIKDLRKEQGLTLKQVARRTGLSESLLSQVENAKLSASLATLQKVSYALNTKMAALFEDL